MRKGSDVDGLPPAVRAQLPEAHSESSADCIPNGWGLLTTVFFVIAVGAGFGALQGAISTGFRLEPFIVTLAGLQIARGLALVISNNQYINISYGVGPGLAPDVQRDAHRGAAHCEVLYL